MSDHNQTTEQSGTDKEIYEIERMWHCLSGFPHDARLRILEYLQDRAAEEARKEP